VLKGLQLNDVSFETLQVLRTTRVSASKQCLSNHDS